MKMSHLQLPSLLEMRLNQAIEKVEVIADGAIEADVLARKTELAAKIKHARDENARLKVQLQAAVQHCVANGFDIQRFEEMAQSHKDSSDRITNAQQRLNDDTAKAELTWNRFGFPRPIVVKKEEMSKEERIGLLTAKMANLKAELTKLQAKQRVILGSQNEYDVLCKLEKKLNKKKRSNGDDGKVTSNQV
ncbi:uncharacterized protein LOC129573367 [Sitodiplosis mosellana]|uniref:uncharacterized protein LOC129573367 n=1 Tax=Sitodiplosis mosellana TaxID=263140 RepID=UPI002444EC49|nr:uncharacterized protein LOC129573367 [Sitodiplosis mosellana]